MHRSGTFFGELGANMYTRLISNLDESKGLWSTCKKLVVMQVSISEDLTLWSTKHHKY